MAATMSETSLKPLQVTRLRREEEEESWISGEELYTEGSSEDEAASTSSTTHSTTCTTHPHHRPTTAPPPHSPPVIPPSAASEPAQQNDPHLTETTRRLSLMGLDQHLGDIQGAVGGNDSDVEEQEEVMLWRPKRGSIKLPHVELDPPAPLLEQVSG